MKKGPRIYYSARQRALIWERWRKGETLHEIARLQNRALAHLVAHKLRLEWSPEQIAGWLQRAHPDDKAFQVSHETIHRSLFI